MTGQVVREITSADVWPWHGCHGDPRRPRGLARLAELERCNPAISLRPASIETRSELLTPLAETAAMLARIQHAITFGGSTVDDRTVTPISSAPRRHPTPMSWMLARLTL